GSISRNLRRTRRSPDTKSLGHAQSSVETINVDSHFHVLAVLRSDDDITDFRSNTAPHHSFSIAVIDVVLGTNCVACTTKTAWLALARNADVDVAIVINPQFVACSDLQNFSKILIDEVEQ